MCLLLERVREKADLTCRWGPVTKTGLYCNDQRHWYPYDGESVTLLQAIIGCVIIGVALVVANEVHRFAWKIDSQTQLSHRHYTHRKELKPAYEKFLLFGVYYGWLFDVGNNCH